MPKNKRKESSDDSDSGPDDRTPVNKKSKPVEKDAGKSSSKQSRGDEEPTWSIDKRRQVKLREFRGKWMVDIREYYEGSNGDLLPGKKGISLSMPQWNNLKNVMDEINDAIKKHV